MNEPDSFIFRMAQACVSLRDGITSLKNFTWKKIRPKTLSGMRKLVRFRRTILPLLGLVLAVGIMVGIIYLYWKDPGILRQLRGLGYFGAFVISIILNATIVLPVSNMTFIISLGATLPHPYLVGVAGGIGAAIGEMTGYVAGRSGRGLLSKSRMYNTMERWVKKRGWIAVFILSIFPFLFDIVGIIAGALRMPIWRFFVACWLGRTIIYVAMSWGASFGIRLLPWFD